MHRYLLLRTGNGRFISSEFMVAFTVGFKSLWTLVGLSDKRFENNFEFYIPITIMVGAVWSQGGGRNNQGDLVITDAEVP